MIFIVMGVSGCGKTTVGVLLARELGLPFYDADDFHPETNVAKMRQGIPLTDEDRQEWLEQLAQNIIKWEGEGGAVVACSALKEKYRKTLQSVPPAQTRWILLHGSRALILERLNARKNHYMSPALLDSQLEILEKPAYAHQCDISLSPEAIVQQILTKI